MTVLCEQQVQEGPDKRPLLFHIYGCAGSRGIHRRSPIASSEVKTSSEMQQVLQFIVIALPEIVPTVQKILLVSKLHHFLEKLLAVTRLWPTGGARPTAGLLPAIWAAPANHWYLAAPSHVCKIAQLVQQTRSSTSGTGACVAD